MRNAITPSLRQPAPQGSQLTLQVFFEIAEEWALSTEQQIILLGSPARSTFFKWKREGGLISKDTKERISHIVAIYKALNILFTNPKSANDWIKKLNKYFGGDSALDVMLRGKLTDIYSVRAYVDAQRGG
jgi:uncharacterized protein (DUF2384 family)